MSSRQRNLDAAIAAWNNSDLDGYLALYDDAITLHGYTPEPMDKTAVRSFYEGIFAAFPDTKLVFHDAIWTDDSVAIRFTMTGTHQGDFMGVPATGREIALPGITILRFDGDRVIERWSQADMLGLLVQLGAVPAPA
jgi:steroid delta-isomerase-like uncharacterized protein